MKQTVEVFHTVFEKIAEHVATIVVDGEVSYALDLVCLCTQNDLPDEERTSWLFPTSSSWPDAAITQTPSVLAKGGCRSTQRQWVTMPESQTPRALSHSGDAREPAGRKFSPARKSS